MSALIDRFRGLFCSLSVVLLLLTPGGRAAEPVTLRFLFVSATPEVAEAVMTQEKMDEITHSFLMNLQAAMVNSGITGVKFEVADSEIWRHPEACIRPSVLEEQKGAPRFYLMELSKGCPAVEEERRRCKANFVVALIAERETGGMQGIAGGADPVPSAPDQALLGGKAHYAAFRIYGRTSLGDTADVFVHEIGHCFGCGHADTQGYGSGPLTAPDSCGVQRRDCFEDAMVQHLAPAFGQEVQIGYRTIMGYDSRYQTNLADSCFEGEHYVLTDHPCFSHVGTDTVAGSKQRYSVGDAVRHNNARVILRNAPELMRQIAYGNDSHTRPFLISGRRIRPELGKNHRLKYSLSDNNLFADNAAESAALPPIPGGEKTAGKSLWYAYVPRYSGRLVVGLETAVPKLLAAYRSQDGLPTECIGSCVVGKDKQLAGLALPARPGERLLFRVDALEGYTGTAFTLQLLPEDRAETPAEKSTTLLDEEKVSGETATETAAAPAAIPVAPPAQEAEPAEPSSQSRVVVPKNEANDRRLADGMLAACAVILLGGACCLFGWARRVKSSVYRCLVEMPDGRVSEHRMSQDDLLRKGYLNVGRAEDNDIVIPHASVSRHHAQFKLKPDGLQIKDLGSTHGTYLPHARLLLQANQGALLHRGSTIRLGDIIIHII